MERKWLLKSKDLDSRSFLTLIYVSNDHFIDRTSEILYLLFFNLNVIVIKNWLQLYVRWHFFKFLHEILRLCNCSFYNFFKFFFAPWTGNLKLIAEYFQRSETLGGPTRDWIGIYEECATYVVNIS